MAVVTEKRLETKFVKWAKEHGAMTVKGPTAQSKGFPDRIVILPNGGGTLYIEFKGSSYYGLTPLQEWWKETLLASNPNRYFVVDSEHTLTHVITVAEAFIEAGNTLIKEEHTTVEIFIHK